MRVYRSDRCDPGRFGGTSLERHRWAAPRPHYPVAIESGRNQDRFRDSCYEEGANPGICDTVLNATRNSSGFRRAVTGVLLINLVKRQRRSALRLHSRRRRTPVTDPAPVLGGNSISGTERFARTGRRVPLALPESQRLWRRTAFVSRLPGGIKWPF